jgi:hypothetical protein
MQREYSFMTSGKANAFQEKALDHYFALYGWASEKMSERCWRSTFRGKYKTYQLQVELSDTWISFRVAPLLFVTQDWQYWPEILHYLLQLNEATQIAKISLDQDGMINLSMQCLALDFDYKKFEMHLGILGYYSDAIYEEIIAYFREIGLHRTHANGYLS